MIWMGLVPNFIIYYYEWTTKQWDTAADYGAYLPLDPVIHRHQSMDLHCLGLSVYLTLTAKVFENKYNQIICP